MVEISEWHMGRGWDTAERHRPECLLVWARGGKESILFIPPPHQHCPVWCEKHALKDQETIGRTAGAAGKFRQQRLKILGKHYYKA